MVCSDQRGRSKPAATSLMAAGEMSPAEFTAFLARADEFHRTGAVRVPGAADLRAEALLTAVARLTAADGDVAAAQADVVRAVEELARETGLKGSVKPDPKWAAARAASARIAPHVQAVRDLAGRITAPDSYADEAVQAEIARWRAVIVQRGIQVG